MGFVLVLVVPGVSLSQRTVFDDKQNPIKTRNKEHEI